GIHSNAARLDVTLARNPEANRESVRVDRVERRRALIPLSCPADLLAQAIEVTAALHPPNDMTQRRPCFYGARKRWIVSRPNEHLAAVQCLEVQCTVGLAHETQTPVEEKLAAPA